MEPRRSTHDRPNGSVRGPGSCDRTRRRWQHRRPDHRAPAGLGPDGHAAHGRTCSLRPRPIRSRTWPRRHDAIGTLPTIDGVPMNEPLIRLTDVNKSFGAHHVLRGISLEVAKSEVLVIIGPSGGGKSTLL